MVTESEQRTLKLSTQEHRRFTNFKPHASVLAEMQALSLDQVHELSETVTGA